MEPSDDQSSNKPEDVGWHVSSHHDVSRREHVFVTNEDEISPIEAIAKLDKKVKG